MRKLAVVLGLIIMLAGCRSAFKSKFNNFNAYYNTFYNAKKSYNAGLEKSLDQKRNYNFLQPIRIHQTPMGAGAQDFQKAIDKGADILRKFDETKWVDDALEIIGKSYYYRREYFSADQKFDELALSSDSEEMKQRAVYWKGRILLELEVYGQGVQYLEEQLSVYDGQWKKRLEFQVRAVLAEHYIERENYVAALDLLNESINKLPERAQKERGYFLIGQLNELLGNSEAAFEAYDKVADYYSEYELQFEAKKKKADVARQLGKTDEAYKVFSSMVRDDKNTEFIADLNYELGKTEQDRGRFKQAESIYLGILRDRRTKPSAVTKAKVYNGLAEVYRFNYDDFAMAATYYDSAANVGVKKEELPESFEAKELAVSFGEYARLKFEVHELDSLLWLGMLPEAKFDSVLAVLEQQKREELERLQKEQEDRANTMINVDSRNTESAAASSERNGFLNVKNPVMLADASQQFKAIWDNRPLADNWRVASLIVNTISQDSTGGSGTDGLMDGQQAKSVVTIDLSRVPFTVAEQDSVRDEIAYRHYELGNLFFLSLNLPDSARRYFNYVIDTRPNSDVAPVSLYSLSEINDIQQNDDMARQQAVQLVDRYPNSIYAERLAEKFDLVRNMEEEQVEHNPIEIYLSIIENDTLEKVLKADSLVQFSRQFDEEKIAPRAMYDGIQLYISKAVEDPGFKEEKRKYDSAITEWDSTRTAFEVLKDSAKIALNDSSLTTSDSLMYTGIMDSVLTEPDFTELIPYYGTYWDSTRSVVENYLSLFGQNSTYGKQVITLKNELELPQEEAETVATDTVSVEQVVGVEPDLVDGSLYRPCTEFDQELSIRGGKDRFMTAIQIPEGNTEDSISFVFFINQRGIIDEFKLSSATTNQALIDEFVLKIERAVSFEPILVNGEAISVQCEVTFPLK